MSDWSIIRNQCSRRAHPCSERVRNSKAVNTTNLLKQLWSHSKPRQKMSLILKKEKITSWPCQFFLAPAPQLLPSQRRKPAVSGAETGPRMLSEASWLVVAPTGNQGRKGLEEAMEERPRYTKAQGGDLGWGQSCHKSSAFQEQPVLHQGQAAHPSIHPSTHTPIHPSIPPCPKTPGSLSSARKDQSNPAYSGQRAVPLEHSPRSATKALRCQKQGGKGDIQSGAPVSQPGTSHAWAVPIHGEGPDVKPLHGHWNVPRYI